MTMVVNDGGGSKPIRVPNPGPLKAHDTKLKSARNKYTTPAPGDYGVDGKHNIRYRTAQAPSFGGNLNKVDRAATGVAAEGAPQERARPHTRCARRTLSPARARDTSFASPSARGGSQRVSRRRTRPTPSQVIARRTNHRPTSIPTQECKR